MFLIITVFLMAGLTAMNYRVSRSVLYPPALLAATWTILLGLLLAAGDKWGFHRADIMRQFRFPEFAGERYIPDGLLWQRIGSQYRIRYVNEPLRRLYFDEQDCMSKRNVELRSRNPRGSQLLYLEQSRFAPTAPLKFKALINYIRFSLHGRLSIAINPITLALFPAGFALWLRDRRALKRVMAPV
jgi:hypothetical protein